MSYESPTYTAKAKRVNDDSHKQNTKTQNFKLSLGSLSQRDWKILEGPAVQVTAYFQSLEMLYKVPVFSYYYYKSTS